jgi:hypothetical protein
MACPTCGGSAREPIAPGYWRCSSELIEVTETGGPGLTNPMAGPGVIRHERVVKCGTTYHEGGGGSVEACACGTFSIGHCIECGINVCGDHSGLFKGSRLCDEHLRAANAAESERRRQSSEREVRESVERRIREWDAWLAEARRSLDGSEPVERAVRLVVELRRARWPLAEFASNATLPSLLVPELASAHVPVTRWWWNHDTVQEWFLRHVKAPPHDVPVVEFRKKIFGGTRRVEGIAAGWSFPSGATKSAGTLTDHPMTVCVLRDGRRLLGANANDGPSVGFNEYALEQMADLAGLGSLPPFPQVSFRHPETSARVWPATD